MTHLSSAGGLGFIAGTHRIWWGYLRRADNYQVLVPYKSMRDLDAVQARGELVRGPFVALSKDEARAKLRVKLGLAKRLNTPPFAGEFTPEPEELI